MTEQKHPFWTELEETHQDVKVLHPLLDLLGQGQGGEDPLMILADLLARIDGRLATIEAALSLPHSPEPVEL